MYLCIYKQVKTRNLVRYVLLSRQRPIWMGIRDLKRQDSSAPVYQNFQVIAIFLFSGVSQTYCLNRTHQNLNVGCICLIQQAAPSRKHKKQGKKNDYNVSARKQAAEKQKLKRSC